jgi:ubiquinone biosynthesis protein COQ9
MYEPIESSKFKKLGTRTRCEQCDSTNVQYHGPKCGHPQSCNPNCKEHGDVEIVMYIFQTIEPKIKRLEELIKNDKQAQQIYERIKELIVAREELHSYEDLVKLLNY